jgi:phage anti-repressor protein
MNELIEVVKQDGEQLVSARELHRALEVGKDFSNWIKDRIEKYDFVEDEDYRKAEGFSPPDSENTKSRVQTTIEYLLTLDTAREIAIVENNEKGREVRRYLIKLEKAWNSPEMLMKRTLEFEDITLGQYGELGKISSRAWREVEKAMPKGKKNALPNLTAALSAYKDAVSDQTYVAGIRMMKYETLRQNVAILKEYGVVTDEMMHTLGLRAYEEFGNAGLYELADSDKGTFKISPYIRLEDDPNWNVSPKDSGLLEA